MGLALSDLGYQAKVQADEVNPLPEDADCPRAKRPGEVSAKVGESGAWGGGGSMATDVVTRGCRPWKWGSSAPLRLPLPFLGPSVDRRGFVPAPPYTGIPRLSTHVAQQSMESRIEKHPLSSVIRSLRSGDSQVGMGA